MTDDVKPRDIIKASHINRITPDDGEVIVGGETGPVRRPLSDFDNSAVLAQVDMDLSGKADISTVDTLAAQVADKADMASVTAVDTKVQRGDKATTIRSGFFPSLQAGLDAAAGGTYTIERGTYQISAPLTPASSTEVIIQAGTTIEQTTRHKPVFDVFNADNVVIRGNGALLTWNGTRLYEPIPSFRAENGYTYGAGVWTNGSRGRFHDLRVRGFACGIQLNGFNGSIIQSHSKVRNEIHNLEVEDVDFGILMSGQDNPIIRGVRGHYSLSSGSPNPSHLLYVTIAGTAITRDIDFDGMVATNGTGGGAYQFKGCHGGTARNLSARNCLTTMSITSCKDLIVDVEHHDAPMNDETGDVYIFGTNERLQVDAKIVAASTATGGRMLRLEAVDSYVRLSGRYRQPASNTNYTALVYGQRNTLDYDVVNVQDNGTDYDTGRQAVNIINGDGHRVIVHRARNMVRAVVVEAAATNATVDVRPGAIRYTSAWVAYAPMVVAKPDTLLSRSGRFVATITAPSQSVRVDPTVHDVVHVTAMTADPFTIIQPYGTPPRGTRLTYIISNTTAGAMGGVSWSGHTTASAWTSPAAGQEISIEFVWDGASWKEIGRTA